MLYTLLVIYIIHYKGEKENIHGERKERGGRKEYFLSEKAFSYFQNYGKRPVSVYACEHIDRFYVSVIVTCPWVDPRKLIFGA